MSWIRIDVNLDVGAVQDKWWGRPLDWPLDQSKGRIKRPSLADSPFKPCLLFFTIFKCFFFFFSLVVFVILFKLFHQTILLVLIMCMCSCEEEVVLKKKGCNGTFVAKGPKTNTFSFTLKSCEFYSLSFLFYFLCEI